MLPPFAEKMPPITTKKLRNRENSILTWKVKIWDYGDCVESLKIYHFFFSFSNFNFKIWDYGDCLKILNFNFKLRFWESKDLSVLVDYLYNLF